MRGKSFRVDKTRLEQIKINSTNAYQYMKKVKKEYLLGKTLKDKLEFIEMFKKNHSNEEIEFLFNELNSYKDNKLFFTNGFQAVYIPLFTIMFTVMNAIFTGLLNFVNSTTMKLLEQDKGFKNIKSIFNFTSFSYNEIINIVVILILLVVLFFSFYVIINYCRYKNYLEFLSYLQSVKNFNGEEENLRD
jgi:hypothetical protein